MLPLWKQFSVAAGKPLVQREKGTVFAAPRQLGHEVGCGLGGPICVLVLDLPFGVG